MVINLVENGLRHAPPGSTIDIALVERPGEVVLTIADDGPGIPAEDREQVMRRFGRLERSLRSEGHGLGLPLVASIVRLHGGLLDLADAGPGLRVTISFPLSRSHAEPQPEPLAEKEKGANLSTRAPIPFG